jgi:hypothetical protein
MRVDIEGLPDLRARLALLAHEADAQLDEVGNDTAESVARRTRVLMPYGPQPGGHAQSSVGVERFPGMRATVSEGGPRFPYVGWLDFGGRVGRRHANHRQWIKGGRYLFPSWRAVRSGVEPSMHLHLREAARRSGWNPSG